GREDRVDRRAVAGGGFGRRLRRGLRGEAFGEGEGGERDERCSEAEQQGPFHRNLLVRDTRAGQATSHAPARFSRRESRAARENRSHSGGQSRTTSRSASLGMTCVWNS